MAETIQSKDLKQKQPGMATQPGTPVNAPRATPQGPGPKGTGFTNIQKIIGANQGNKLGSAVVGGIQRTGQQAQQGLNQATTQFQGDLAANRLDTQANEQAAGNLVNTAGTGGTLSEEDMKKAAMLRSGNYSGPTDIQNANLLAGRAAEAEQLGRMGASEGGRQGLLQRFVGAPQYNQGQQRLDSLLLGANSQAINQARSATQGLADQSARQIQGARAQGQEAVGAAQQFGQNFLNSIKGKTGEIEGASAQALAAAQESEKLKSYTGANVNAALNRPGDMVKNINSVPGLSPEQKQQLTDVINQAVRLKLDPKVAVQNAVQYQAGNLTKDTVETAQQAAARNALSRLAGNEGYANAQAGKYQAGANTLDIARQKQALSDIESGKGTTAANIDVPGVNNVSLLKEITTSPEKSWQNPNAVKQMLTPDEYQLYEYTKGLRSDPPANKIPGGWDEVKRRFNQRATDNYARVQGNDAATAAARDAYSKGRF